MRPSETLAKHNQDVKNIFSKYPLKKIQKYLDQYHKVKILKRVILIF